MYHFQFFDNRWVWSEANSQPELENMLEIGGFGYPAMAVLNAKKMKYSILRGSFSSDGINEFLRYTFKIIIVTIIKTAIKFMNVPAAN